MVPRFEFVGVKSGIDEVEPVVVMAALGSSNTFDAVWTITETSEVIPSLSDAGGEINEIVTGYVTTLLTTVETGAIEVTTPLISALGNAGSVMVAVWCT